MSSEICNCIACGQLYIAKRGEKLCTDCSREQQAKLTTVRHYLRENQGKTAPEIAEALDLSLDFVLGLVREGILLSS